MLAASQPGLLQFREGEMDSWEFSLTQTAECRQERCRVSRLITYVFPALPAPGVAGWQEDLGPGGLPEGLWCGEWRAGHCLHLLYPESFQPCGDLSVVGTARIPGLTAVSSPVTKVCPHAALMARTDSPALCQSQLGDPNSASHAWLGPDRASGLLPEGLGVELSAMTKL